MAYLLIGKAVSIFWSSFAIFLMIFVEANKVVREKEQTAEGEYEGEPSPGMNIADVSRFRWNERSARKCAIRLGTPNNTTAKLPFKP